MDQAGLVHLDDVKSVRSHIQQIARSLVEHKAHAEKMFESLGSVQPTAEHFKGEWQRYMSVMAHVRNPSYCQLLVSIRELLQNSVDAKASSVSISWLECADLQNATSSVLNAGYYFLCASDNGVWCDPSELLTYNRVSEYFLRMNGSSKSGSQGMVGGFGVGRFIIMFCAPLWAFTARHLLVIGHYNIFKILCRRCLAPNLKSSACEVCGLAEFDVPAGTTFLINYSMFNDSPARDGDGPYISIICERYLAFCDFQGVVVRAGARQVVPVKRNKRIFKGKFMSAFAIGGADAHDEVCSTYMVCMANGTFMFSRVVYGNASNGRFLVALDPAVKFLHDGRPVFTQARDGFALGAVRDEFDAFLHKQQDSHDSNDIDLQHSVVVHGLSPRVADHDGSTSSAASARPQSRGDELKEVVRIHKDRPSAGLQPLVDGLIECIYMFRNGKRMETVDPMWRPSKNAGYEQAYVLMLWAKCVSETLKVMRLPDFEFSVGMIFDDIAEAIYQLQPSGKSVFYVNPEVLYKYADKNLQQSSRHKLVSWMMSRAIHEVSHVWHGQHDSKFCSVMTEATASVFSRMVFRTVFDEEPHIRIVAMRVAKASKVAAATEGQSASKKRRVGQP